MQLFGSKKKMGSYSHKCRPLLSQVCVSSSIYTHIYIFIFLNSTVAVICQLCIFINKYYVLFSALPSIIFYSQPTY